MGQILYQPTLTPEQIDLLIGLTELDAICDDRAEGWTEEMYDSLLKALREAPAIR